MSVLGKKWLIKNQNDQKSIFDKILENRGWDKIEELNDFHDPFLFEEMEKAVNKINEAIENHDRVIVFGDYDVDGISGTAVLVHTLKKLGANVSFRLPNRVTDGYGLSMKFIDEFIEKEIALVITVDCGICCRKEIQKAKDHGIETIITDHHTVPEIPPEAAYAILHPKKTDCKYPFKELTGAGVALKLAHALIKRNLFENQQAEFLNSLLDLATLGTIADLGSLRDENRLIVSRGLDVLANTKWKGLRRIKELARFKEGEEMDPTKIGFQIAPRINAAGRIGDPYTALFLLLQEEESEKLHILGDKLEKLNKERQIMTEKALGEAEQYLLGVTEVPDLIIAHSPDWHVGILGLIAGKLAEKYGRPAIAMQDLGDVLVASARSPSFFNVVEAIAHCKDSLVTFGGHAQAAGFNVKKEKLEEFKEKITAFAVKKLENLELQSTLEIDCELTEQDLNFDLFTTIQKLKPFGVDNRKPTFVIKNLEPHYVEQVGHNGNHLKFVAHLAKKHFPVIAFKLGPYSNQLKSQKRIDLVFHLEKQNWNSRNHLELHALDFKYSV